MARRETTQLTEALASALPRERVEQAASKHGVVRRKRTVDVFVLVWTLVLGFHAGAARTLAGLRTAYAHASGRTLVPSAFYKRLNSKLAAMLRLLATDAMAAMVPVARAGAQKLAGFVDLLALDSTVVKLHDLLAPAFPACRTNCVKAALKIHSVISVLDGRPSRVRVSSERVSDGSPWRRVEDWVRGHLLLFDLGYFCYHTFYRIDVHGGFFVSRMKANANPVITAVHRVWRGRAVPVVGQRLLDVLSRIERDVLDVEVEAEFAKRTYGGRKTMTSCRFRVVAVRNEATSAYHCYITNVPPERLAGEDITNTYALRWQIEIFFKAMKSHGRLEQLPSANRAVVECLIWASVLAMIASRTLHAAVRAGCASNRHLPTLRWAALFARVAGKLLGIAVAPAPAEAAKLWRVLIHEAPDPNLSRADRALGWLDI